MTASANQWRTGLRFCFHAQPQWSNTYSLNILTPQVRIYFVLDFPFCIGVINVLLFPPAFLLQRLTIFLEMHARVPERPSAVAPLRSDVAALWRLRRRTVGPRPRPPGEDGSLWGKRGSEKDGTRDIVGRARKLYFTPSLTPPLAGGTGAHHSHQSPGQPTSNRSVAYGVDCTHPHILSPLLRILSLPLPPLQRGPRRPPPRATSGCMPLSK